MICYKENFLILNNYIIQNQRSLIAHCRAVSSNSGVWKTLTAIQTESANSAKKLSDIAMGRNLVNEAAHKKRQLKRSNFLNKVAKVVTRGEGTHRDKLRAMAALQEKSEAE